MKKFVALVMALVMVACCAMAQQEYEITGDGISPDGKVIVNVVVSQKKKIERTAQTDVLRSAVEGVLFRGVSATGTTPQYPPLVSSPALAQQKAAFFNAFFAEDTYKNFATLVPMSLSVMKNQQTKKHEATGRVIVDRERLQNYLEECDIITGFSDLW